MRRDRAQVFTEVLEKLKERRFVVRAELSRSILTDGDLFKKIIESLIELGLIKSSYVLTSSGRQRETLEITPNIENTDLVVRALAKVIAPTASEIFSVWYNRKHPTASHSRTKEQLEKEASDKRFFNSVRRSFESERTKEG